MTIGSSGHLTWPAGSGGSMSISGNLVNDGTIGNATVKLLDGHRHADLRVRRHLRAERQYRRHGHRFGHGWDTRWDPRPERHLHGEPEYNILNGAFTGSFSTLNGWVVTTNPTNVTMKHA